MPNNNTSVVSNNQNHITSELKNRLITAKKNGDAVSSAILKRFKNEFDALPDEAKNQTFTSKRITNRGRTVHIQIIGTKEDGTRTVYEAATFAQLVLPSDSNLLSSDNLEKFKDAIAVTSRMRAFVCRGFKSLRKAFLGDNFSQERTMTCSLNPSFVTDQTSASMYAHFYSQIVPSRVIIIKDKDGKIMARSVVYDDVEFSKRNTGSFRGSFLGRVYFTADAARDYLINYAKKIGILVYQSSQDPTSSLALLSPPEDTQVRSQYNNILSSYGGAIARVEMKGTWKYKGGMPFIDLFKFTAYHSGKLYLENADFDHEYAVVGFNQNVEGVMSIRQQVCPVCGRIFQDAEFPICQDCSQNGGMVSTLFGEFLSMDTQAVPHWGRVPKGCVVNGRITDSAIVAIMLNRFASKPPVVTQVITHSTNNNITSDN